MAKKVSIKTLFADYAHHHQDPRNRLTHYFGIPLIVLSLFGLLGAIRIGPQSWEWTEYLRLDGGWLLILLGMPWYVRKDARLSVPFGFAVVGLNFFARIFPVPVLAGIFIFGWALQFAGHILFEKRSPAFIKNLEHLLVGPFWILDKILR